MGRSSRQTGKAGGGAGRRHQSGARRRCVPLEKLTHD